MHCHALGQRSWSHAGTLGPVLAPGTAVVPIALGWLDRGLQQAALRSLHSTCQLVEATELV